MGPVHNLLGIYQGGPQMRENVENYIAINFPHLKNTLKLPKNTDFENIDSTYSPQNMKPGHVLTVYNHLETNKNIIKISFICWFVLMQGVLILFIILGVL